MNIYRYTVRKIRNSLLYRHIRVSVFKKPIRIWFYREDDFLNFGDELTADIIERLFGKSTIRTSIEDADLFGVGSIIEVINHPRQKTSYVWGSGLMWCGDPIENGRLDFKAVRGSETLSRIGGRSVTKDVVIGDPGLLSNLIYSASSNWTGKIGIIPHYVDEDNPILDQARTSSDLYTVISVKSKPEEVARQITECSVIFSSSLHGLIVSDSFGIPNVHMPLSDKVAGGEYKFIDYYSATGREYTTFSKELLYTGDDIERATKLYRPISRLDSIQSDLIKSFPF